MTLPCVDGAATTSPPSRVPTDRQGPWPRVLGGSRGQRPRTAGSARRLGAGSLEQEPLNAFRVPGRERLRPPLLLAAAVIRSGPGGSAPVLQRARVPFDVPTRRGGAAEEEADVALDRAPWAGDGARALALLGREKA